MSKLGQGQRLGTGVSQVSKLGQGQRMGTGVSHWVKHKEKAQVSKLGQGQRIGIGVYVGSDTKSRHSCLCGFRHKE